VTTTRPVLSFSNFRANKAFYETLFLPENGEMPRLGDVMRRTKNNSLNGVNNRNFSLLGDPSMRLAYPQRRLRFTEWQGRPWTDADTASALMPLHIAGEVLDEAGQRDASFEGWAEVALYDRPARRQTRGDDDENVPMAYEAFDDVLFRGVVPVAAGRFEVRLVVPKDASYGYGQGKVVAYTQARDGLPDAQGFGWMRVGGTAGSPEADTQGPQLLAWLESRAFEPGDVVPRQPLLLLEAEDASGFNLSGKGVGRDWEAVVDDEETWRYALQSRLRLDTGRFDRGQLAFLLPHPLPPGKHTLRLRGYDAYNNLTELLLEFAVAGGVQAQWQALWPNPTEAGVQWALSHNRAGDDLALDWEICDVQGRVVWQHRETAYASEAVLRRAWNGTDAQGRPLRPGVYVLRVRLQSLADGQETQAMRRLSVLR
jgi:hypothetical protein